MRNLVLAIVALVVFSSVAIGHLLRQLQTEHNAVAILRQRVEQLELTQHMTRSAPAETPIAIQESVAVPFVAALSQSQPTERRPIPRGLLRDFSNRYPEIEKELNLTLQELEILAQGDAGYIQPFDVEALIGHGKYEQFLERKTSSETDRLMNTIRLNFASADHHLSDFQDAQLAPLLHAELSRRMAEDKFRTLPNDLRSSLNYREGRLKTQQASDLRIVAGARAFLTQEQIAVLESNLLRLA